MQRRDFPYNLEPYLLGRPLRLEQGPRRQLVTLRLVMQQILKALKVRPSRPLAVQV